ncbi:adhesion G protein-coupled receptor F4-like [Gambusia affinis]|uniref:adhesion G protein-coupled receptor F4-like n=1 Tax=Gambusia affinis TaxID=33528 RepID=UPI001CDC4BC2|nr:adhesion G protein-coupled receptor F4-like [Gambusia affinis]
MFNGSGFSHNIIVYTCDELAVRSIMWRPLFFEKTNGSSFFQYVIIHKCVQFAGVHHSKNGNTNFQMFNDSGFSHNIIVYTCDELAARSIMWRPLFFEKTNDSSFFQNVIVHKCVQFAGADNAYPMIVSNPTQPATNYLQSAAMTTTGADNAFPVKESNPTQTATNYLQSAAMTTTGADNAFPMKESNPTQTATNYLQSAAMTTTVVATRKSPVTCNENGTSGSDQGDCVPAAVMELLGESEKLNNETLLVFLEKLKVVSVNSTKNISKSPDTISSIVKALSNIANRSSLLSMPINKESTENILQIAGLLTSDETKASWDTLNMNDKTQSSGTENGGKIKSSSASLLNLFESVATLLVNESFSVETPFIHLNRTHLKNKITFSNVFNTSMEIDIPEASGGSQFITTIVFASMNNVLPPRDEHNSSSMVINGKVVLATTAAKIRNISITSRILNDTLGNPKCVFWNFSLFDDLGGWSDSGCSLVSHNNETISCSCNHLTSFSMLMSPEIIEDEQITDITIIGVGISIASLVICLITEALTWKKISTNTTAYLRHVSIINIAVSLLIANIWFIIGAYFTDDNKKKNPAVCVTVTFFIHLFYLAMFFWMLASGLLLLYRTVFVFEGGLSKTSMLAIGFVLGYAAPLVIAITTVAVTVPSQKYIRGNRGCWLNWEDSKALLSFLAPALVIVAINFLILLVVIYKMVSRREVRNTGQGKEQHVLVVIARSLAVLTPFFGLTWSLGIGTIIDPKNKEVNFAFVIFNSLQGCFIWVFGTLLDKKVRSETIKYLSSQDKLVTS